MGYNDYIIKDKFIMENNYKKGFSLAEMLIVFLLISIMLSVFAPVMTKSAKRRYDPNCPTGIKTLIVEYTEPGAYEWTAPNNIAPIENNAIITIIGAGGAGSDGTYDPTYGYSAGTGGGGGAYISFPTKLEPGAYSINVGAGGVNGASGGESIFNGNTIDDIKALGGKGGSDDPSPDGHTAGGSVIIPPSIPISKSTGSSIGKIKIGYENGESGYPATSDNGGTGGGNDTYGSLTTAGGKICADENCNPNGRPGSSYAVNGLSELGFVAGMGGGGGGYSQVRAGSGGRGGDGYVRIEYQLRCD